MVFLAGFDTKETIHKENNVRLKLNVEEVYYSARYSTERKRIMQLVKPGEDILIMFSGAAPFVCVLSKNTKAKEIIGIELNPIGHSCGCSSSSASAIGSGPRRQFPRPRPGAAWPKFRNGYRPGFDAQPPFEKQLETLSLVAGTPDQCVAKLKYLIEHTRPSILALWGSDGGIRHEDTKTCIRLLGQEVLRASASSARNSG